MIASSDVAREMAQRRHSPAGRARDLIRSLDPDDLTGWAVGIADTLPPATDAEAAAWGLLAAAIDARRQDVAEQRQRLADRLAVDGGAP
jgi:hypothetical protein